MTDLRTLSPQQINEIRPFGGFQVILADPPWKFSGNSDAKPGKNVRKHYPTLTPAEISAIPVKALAARDALLLMWVTVPTAEIAMGVIRAWGFRYKSQLVWPKGRIGTGYYARNEHELVYIARRGRFPVTPPAMFPTSIVAGSRREHSRKPEWVHEKIEARFPELAKLELFARCQRDGWTAMGNQTDKFDGATDAATIG